MLKRVSHKKSRRGCQACKRRHIKCDEQGPPCANCVARNTYCDYVVPENASGSGGAHSHSASAGASASASASRSSPSRTETSTASGSSEPRSIIELELMHRWSTHTYRSMCGTPEEAYYLSKVMPREALKHDFMLDGIFAVTALDIARSSEEPDATKYEHIALEYYNRGSASFRALLTDIPPDIYHLMFIFASSAAVIILGLPDSTRGSGSGGEQTALERITTLSDLFYGAILIVNAGWDKIVEGYVPMRAALSTKVDKPDILDPSQPVNRSELPYRLASLDLLDDDIKTVCERLDAVNDKVHEPPTQTGSDGDDEPEIDAMQEKERSAAHDMYKLAIYWLKEGFAEQTMDVVKGYCLTFFILAGREFAVAAKASQPLALFILMHWAVQLDKLGEEAWWARTIGKQLVREVSEFLATSPLGLLQETRDNIAWARLKVGLPT